MYPDVPGPARYRQGRTLVILVTRLNGPAFALNPDLVERAEGTPDTVVTLVDGTKYVIAESVDEFIALVRRYRAGVLAEAQLLTEGGPAAGGCWRWRTRPRGSTTRSCAAAWRWPSTVPTRKSSARSCTARSTPSARRTSPRRRSSRTWAASPRRSASSVPSWAWYTC